MGTLFTGASGVMINGGTFNATTTNISQSKRGIDLLMDWIATDAFHNSKELYDAPKCHPHTRVAVLADIMEWVIECEVQDEFMVWLFGPAGAGKSAIAKRVAELAAEKGLLIGSFFFSRTSPTRNTQDRLIPTLAYQMALSMPATRTHIQQAIETDPAIFHKDIRTQIDTLLMKPFQFASAQTTPCPKLFIIDGLDECNDRKSQVAILDAISHSFTTHKLPIRCLVVSRPEIDLAASFSGKEPLKSIHRRLALDDNYLPYDDIRLFFSDKFEEIRCTHRLRSTIPIPWPTEESLETLVRRSSGQFIFAATVVRYVESNRHRPDARLNIILGISPPDNINPFTELDALYKQLLSSVENIQLTLRVLSFQVSSPHIANWLCVISMSEHFLSLEEGDIDRALIDLSSIVSHNQSYGEVKILHASLFDFLSDKRRSDEFHIDMANARADIACRTFQYVKGPDGIRAGDFNFLTLGTSNTHWILNAQLRNEILNFDLDAFITAAIKSPYSTRDNAVSWIFKIWMDLIPKMGFEGGDEQLLILRCRQSFESRMQKYQSNWRLQVLFTLAQVMDYSRDYLPTKYLPSGMVPLVRCLDILLEMNDEDLHCLDQDALDLRYCQKSFEQYTSKLGEITSRYVDDDKYAFAALHCMRFLSNPAIRKGSPEMSIVHTHEWEATLGMVRILLCGLLERANTLPEVIQFMSDHDISKMVQEEPPAIHIWRLNSHILAFLSRGGVCVNWRIVSAVQRALAVRDGSKMDEWEETDSYMDESETSDWDMDKSEENGSHAMSLSDG